MQPSAIRQIVLVAMNPAIDRVMAVRGLALGAHQHATLLGRHAAGKAVNVARGLSVLDVPAVLAGLLGHEEQEFFRRDLLDTQVDMRMVLVAGRTRENITLVDPLAQTETHLRERGFDVQPNELAAVKRQLAQLAGPNTLFVFSGSLPVGLAPNVQAEMVQICRKCGSKVAVDGSGPPLQAAVEAGPWLLKPNRAEFEELLGRLLPDEASLVAAGAEMARSVDLVLVTCGADGAYLFTSNGIWRGRCDLATDQCISTVGCGDGLLTGFIAGLYRGLLPEAALAMGLAAATATATNQSAAFTLAAYETFLTRTVVFPLPDR